MLPVALAVGLLTVGCAGGVSAPGAPHADAADSSAASSSGAAGEAGSDSIADAPLMPVGPLAIPAADFWAPGEDTGSIAVVTAGGCEDGTNCPAFAVVSGAGAHATDQAILDDGIGCPGGEGMMPVSATPASAQATPVAGSTGTVQVFDVTCADADGAGAIAIQQRQWSVGGAEGLVTIVDRWSFAELGDRVAGAQWLDEAGE
ncbi:hypothetical protein [Demequina aurantiaca]|uniref:hypothetical protein n=1 Tax=Demequina aurantiaca TaxID=676200 RepID=UPI000784D725|nr:hypothetical protein [Demequina aurantiaca]